jgi:hypothetical protein
MKILLTLAAFFALAVPAAFAVPPTGTGNQGTSNSSAGITPSAAQLCRQQRHTIGMAAFRLLYAPSGTPKAAMSACLSKQSVVVSTEAKNAAKECKTERGTTPDSIAAFNDTYGENGNKANAFGKCVSMKARGLTLEQQQATLNAAQKCKAERGTSATTISAFNAKYGTSASKKNAFAQCVKTNKSSS